MDKIQVFKTELSWIQDDKIRAFAEKLVECAPDYFFEVAASSTGKFHPAYSLGPGGLVRHSKAAAKILHELCELEMFNKYSQEKKDLMLAAIVAHDFFKHGLPEKMSKYTVAEHPVVCANFIKANEGLCAMLSPEQVVFICDCIATHMGQWNTDYRTKREILPKPQTGAQNLVHLADYLASRKYLLMDFENDYYEPEKPAPEVTVNEKDEELVVTITEINAMCKAKIEAGANRKDLYALIADINEGNRNPNSIKTMERAIELKQKLEEFNV